MRKIYLIAIIVILIALGLYLFLINKKTTVPQNQQNAEQPSFENSITREEIMNDVAGKISSLSPVKAVLGGNWYVARFWFIKDSNTDFYAEYEDGHIMARILVKAEKTEDKLNYKIIAYFEPGENDWTLKQGEDKYFGMQLDLYEHNEELGKWMKKN